MPQDQPLRHGQGAFSSLGPTTARLARTAARPVPADGAVEPSMLPGDTAHATSPTG